MLLHNFNSDIGLSLYACVCYLTSFVLGIRLFWLPQFLLLIHQLLTLACWLKIMPKLWKSSSVLVIQTNEVVTSSESDSASSFICNFSLFPKLLETDVTIQYTTKVNTYSIVHNIKQTDNVKKLLLYCFWLDMISRWLFRWKNLQQPRAIVTSTILISWGHVCYIYIEFNKSSSWQQFKLSLFNYFFFHFIRLNEKLLPKNKTSPIRSARNFYCLLTR